VRAFEDWRQRAIRRDQANMPAGRADMRFRFDRDETRGIVGQPCDPHRAFAGAFGWKRHPGDLRLNGGTDGSAARADVASGPHVEPLVDRAHRPAVTGFRDSFTLGMCVGSEGVRQSLVDVAAGLPRKLPCGQLGVLAQHRFADGAALSCRGERLRGEHAGDRK
jgi:hypothetical protein